MFGLVFLLLKLGGGEIAEKDDARMEVFLRISFGML